MRRTISGMIGAGSLAHNRRDFVAENVDPDRVHLNICYQNENLKEVYKELFDDSVERYNVGKRKDRQITNYYEKIRQGKQEKLFHEVIFQIGNREDMAVGTTEGDLAVKVLDERFNEHLTFKLCEDLALSLCNLFGNKEDDNTLSSTIEKYIKENYKDPSLGLNKISDEFQISESYFSHMFKEKTGVNFSTYLENIRMTEAARLIKETDISLNELYIAVGYNNSNTFRRAFKKVYGVTPSAMREK